MKLFRVTVEVELMVLAEDEADALALGEACAPDELKNGSGHVDQSEVEPGDKLGHWADCFPYAEDQGAVQQTCGEWLAARAVLEGAK